MSDSDLHFQGTDLLIEAFELNDQLVTDLKDCGGPGDATNCVEYVLKTYEVTGDPEDCRNYLKGYGAWDDDELTDHYTNLERLVWLTGCALCEDEDGATAYFSTY